MTAAGVGLALASPAGPVQPVPLVFRWEEEYSQQTPHFRGGHRDQVAAIAPLFVLAWDAARVISRKA